MSTKEYDTIVIGAGPAGMTAAIASARSGANTLLIEKNQRLGEKLRITGGGRCNITNTDPNLRSLLANYTSSEKFLYSSFTQFGVTETIEFFDELQLPIKTEARYRAFPVSEDANDVVEALEYGMTRERVTVMLGTTVENILVDDARITHVQTSNGTFKAKSIVLATGGSSRPETGSTGDGFNWLEELNHSVTEPTPNITPIKIVEKYPAVVAGTKAHEAIVRVRVDGKSQFKVQGDVLFTHFGLSGPTILNNAYRIADLLQAGEVTIELDLTPATSAEELDAKIIDCFEANPAKQLKNVITEIAPEGMSKLVVAVLEDSIDLQVKTSEVSKQVRAQLVNAIKHLKLTVSGLMGFDKAVVADGGVPLNEINMRTYQSMLVDNLFVTGDLLHINRPSGGFSLQLCWTSGYIAGKEAALQATK